MSDYQVNAMDMPKLHCRTCGVQITDCYMDTGGLGFAHGDCQCRDCYVKDGHPECPNCGVLMLQSWGFCAHCGVALARGASG